MKQQEEVESWKEVIKEAVLDERARILKIIDEIATPIFDIETKKIMHHILVAEHLKQKIEEKNEKS